MTLPSLTVLLDDGSGSFPYDISKYAQVDPGYSFSRGRADWQGGVTTSVLNIQLNNSDGRFTVGSTLIASPSPVNVDQRIRVRETINGSTFTEYTGYVKSWPVEWPATVATIAMTGITATDAQARAERRPLRSVIEEEVLLSSANWYYTLGEPTGATSAADSSGSQAALMTSTGTGTAVSFGADAGPSTSSATAATFANGQYLRASDNLLFLVGFAPITAFVAFKTTASGTAMSLLGSSLSGGTALIGIDATGHVTTSLAGGLTSPATVNDGTWHVASVTMTTAAGGSVGLCLDGAVVATGADTFGATVARELGKGYTGSLAHAAYMPSVSLASILAYATAILTGFADESGVARITRLCGYAGLPLGTLDASLTTVAAVDIAGTSAWDAIQEVVDAEMGAAYLNGSGTVTFHNRDRVRLKTAPDLTLSAISYVTPDVAPLVDDQQIVNYFEGASSATGVTQLARNTASETTHGRYPGSQSYLVSTDAEALDRANWVVVNFAEPTARYGTLTINLLKVANENPAMAAAILAAVDIDCWLRVTNMASQNPTGTTVDVVVQGFTKTRTANSWLLTCNVVLRSLYNVAIYDDATYGIYDDPKARFGV